MLHRRPVLHLRAGPALDQELSRAHSLHALLQGIRALRRLLASRRQRDGREFHRGVPASMSGRHGEDQVAHSTAGGARRAGLRGGSGFGRDDERNALLHPAAAVVLRVHAPAGHDVPGAGRRESRVPRLLVLLRRAGEGLAGEGAEDEEGEGGRERRVREGEERGQDDAVGPRRAEASLLRRERSVPVRVGCGWRE